MRWLVAILFLLPIFCNAQKRVPFGGTAATDTAYAGRSILVDSNVRFLKYATSDTNRVAGFDALGNLVWRTKNTPANTLQQVTDAGATTTNTITANSLILTGVPAGDINDEFLVMHPDGTVGYGNDGTFYKFASDTTGANGYTTRRVADSLSWNKKAYRITLEGQSNVIGRGLIADLATSPYNIIPDSLTNQFYRVFICDSTGTYHNLLIGSNNEANGATAFGVELPIAYRWLLNHKEGYLFIDKFGASGAAITYFAKGGAYYTYYQTKKDSANRWLNAHGYNVQDVGYIWMQGEANYTNTYSYYKPKLDSIFNDRLSDGYLNTQTRIIISSIPTASVRYGTGVDSAFNYFVAERANARLVNNATTPLLVDNIHYGTSGIFTIGYNSYEKILDADSLTIGNPQQRIKNIVSVASVRGDANGNIPLTKSDISLGNVENTALSTWAGSTNITTIGTIATGYWSATAIPINKGGTGVTAVGAANQVLATNSTATGTEWQTLSTGASTGYADSVAGTTTPNTPHRHCDLIIAQTTSSGDLDLYTVPAGKKMYVAAMKFYNTSGSTVSAYGEVKISGTYYRLTNTQSVLTTASQFQTVQFCFTGGQTIAVNATGTGLNVFMEMVEFDSATGFKTVYITGCASGDQTLYTVPTGKSATIFGGLPIIFNGGPAFNFVADAGGTRTIYFNAVPNGGSPSSSNQLRAAYGTTASGRASLTDPVSLGAGDYINLNVSTGNAAQIAWINIQEWNN